jgi:hypothetical protein
MRSNGAVSVITDRATEGMLVKSVESRQVPLITEDESVKAISVSVSSSVGKIRCVQFRCVGNCGWSFRCAESVLGEFQLCNFRCNFRTELVSVLGQSVDYFQGVYSGD